MSARPCVACTVVERRSQSQVAHRRPIQTSCGTATVAGKANKHWYAVSRGHTIPQPAAITAGCGAATSLQCQRHTQTPVTALCATGVCQQPFIGDNVQRSGPYCRLRTLCIYKKRRHCYMPMPCRTAQQATPARWCRVGTEGPRSHVAMAQERPWPLWTALPCLIWAETAG